MIPILLFIIDSVLINVALLLSFLIRYGSEIPGYNFNPYKSNFAFLTLMYMLAFVIARCFQQRFVNYWSIFRNILMGQLFGTLFGIVLIYVFRSQWSTFPSSIFVICFPVGSILIFLVNSVVLKFAGRIKKKILIIGKENSLSFFENRSLVEKIYINNIEEVVQHKEIDEIVMCEQVHGDRQLNLLIYLLLKLKVNVVFSPVIYSELLSGNVMQENSIQFLKTFIGRKSDSEEFVLRTFDLVFSVILLIILSPLILVVALLIKRSSRGPVFYKQDRIAKDGEVFTLYKFRTMVDGAEEKTGPVLASENDLRVTKIGRFLRATRIDEIPQLFNVILGQMSLVGPRPERPYFVKRHKALREIRLAVKPGLTGLAQIRNSYDLHPKHKIKYDYLYIQKRSLLLNLYIIMKTIPVIFSKKGQ